MGDPKDAVIDEAMRIIALLLSYAESRAEDLDASAGFLVSEYLCANRPKDLTLEQTESAWRDAQKACAAVDGAKRFLGQHTKGGAYGTAVDVDADPRRVSAGVRDHNGNGGVGSGAVEAGARS